MNVMRRGSPASGWWEEEVLQGAGAFANLSTFRLSGFPTCWKVGKLAGWCGGVTAGGSGRGFLVYPGVRRAGAAVNVGWGV